MHGCVEVMHKEQHVGKKSCWGMHKKSRQQCNIEDYEDMETQLNVSKMPKTIINEIMLTPAAKANTLIETRSDFEAKCTCDV